MRRYALFLSLTAAVCLSACAGQTSSSEAESSNQAAAGTNEETFDAFG